MKQRWKRLRYGMQRFMLGTDPLIPLFALIVVLIVAGLISGGVNALLLAGIFGTGVYALFFGLWVRAMMK